MTRATRARTDVIGSFSHRPAATPPVTGASEDLFSITGQILMTGFYGLLTSDMSAESIDFDIDLDPDDGGADAALASTIVMDSKVSGTWLTLNATTGGILIASVDIGANLALETPLPLVAGDVKLVVSGGGATNGTVEWGLFWLPLSADGAVAVV